MMNDTVLIARYPDGQMVSCSALKVTPDLAVVQLPEEGYSVTHVHTGYAVAFFAHADLAEGCLREVEPLMDWSGVDVGTMKKRIYEAKGAIQAVKVKWEQDDDELCESEEGVTE